MAAASTTVDGQAVTLAADEALTSPTAAPAATVAPPTGVATSHSKVARVLYIEDNPVNALIVRELIAQHPNLQLTRRLTA